MNTKNNQRSRATDEKIVRAVFELMLTRHKTVDKVTVREICEKAEINRSTFYAHYQDVYDLVEKVEQSMSRQLTETFFRKLDESAPARDCFAEIFSFIREHREFYLYYLTESRQYGILQLTWETIRNRAAAVSADPRSFGVDTQEDLAYHGIFFLSGLSAMVRLWLQNGCREEPAALYDLLRRQGAVQEAMIGW